MQYDRSGDRMSFFCRMDTDSQWREVPTTGKWLPGLNKGGTIRSGRIAIFGKNWSGSV